MVIYWLLETGSTVPAGNAWLAAIERQAQPAVRFAKRRRDWRLGRWTAKRALAAHLREIDLVGEGSAPLKRLSIRAAADGAPEPLLDHRPLALSLSISHRDGLGLCALVTAPAALGCDLERVEPRSRAFVADYLTGDEQRLVEEAPEESALRVNLIWSAKESALKALRTGLRLDPRAVAVRPAREASRGSWQPLTVEHADRTLHGWWRHRGEHVLTVVADRPSSLPVVLQPGFDTWGADPVDGRGW